MANADATFRIEVEVDPGSARQTVSNLADAMRGGFSGLEGQAGQIEKALDGIDQGGKKAAQGLSTTRYALYDVSQTLGVVGAGLTALAVAPVMVAASFEREFANVTRTVGSEIGYANPLLDELRRNLIELSQTIPVAFGDLSQIATLGGQLGIAATGIDEFTSVVARLGATTDLSFEQAGTAIGRFAAILGVPEREFENLASSILKVGVNSVATETQIVNISTQISSMGAYAGLSADQVVGLAGALASVGAQPELSRGTITRTFTQMSRAIGEGGDRLDAFARIAGTTSQEFAAAFGTDRFAGVLQSFIQGLGNMQARGEDANMALRELGITSVRDVPLLMRLGLAQDTVTAAFADAANGYAEATDLNDQYGVVAETTAAKLQVLGNNVQAILDALGSGSLGPLSAFADRLIDIANAITDLADNPLGQWGATIGVTIAGLVGVLALAGAAFAAAFAGIIALQQALMGLTGQAAVTSVGLRGFQAQLALLGPAGRAAAAGIGFATAAMRGLGIAAAVLIGIELGRWLNDWIDEMVLGTKTIDQMAHSLRNIRVDPRASDTGDFIGGFARLDSGLQNTLRTAMSFMDAIPGIGLAVRATVPDAYNAALGFEALEGALMSAAESGGIDVVIAKLEDLAKTSGITYGELLSSMPELQSLIQGVLEEDGAAGADTFAPLELSAEEAKAAIDELANALLNFNSEGLNIEQATIKFYEALNGVRDAASDAGVRIDGTDKASLAFRQRLVDAELAARNMAQALIDNGGSAEYAISKYEEMRNALVSEIESRGYSEGAARAWADTILGTTGEATAKILEYDDAVNDIPEAKDTKVTNNANEQRGPVQMYIDQLNNIPRNIHTTLVMNAVTTGNYSSTGVMPYMQTRAQGGPIYGPGTPTSDSIPAWLSTGEYVIKAASVQKYGSAFMNALNAGKIPKFANGGQVGSGSSASMGGIVELGPRSLRHLSREVTNNIMIGNETVAHAANTGNAVHTRRGGR